MRLHLQGDLFSLMESFVVADGARVDLFSLTGCENGLNWRGSIAFDDVWAKVHQPHTIVVNTYIVDMYCSLIGQIYINVAIW